MSRRRVAVVSSCPPPKAGQPVTGGGLRTLQLVETVRAAGHVPSLIVGGEGLAERLKKLRPSAVVLEQWALAAHLGDFAKPVAIDLHGSLLLENVYRRGDVELTMDAGAKIDALHRADLLLVPSVAQLSWFGSWATLAGFDPTDLPLQLLPLALPGEPVRRKAKKPALRLVYGGARWPWIDSRDALVAAAGHPLDVFTYEPPREGPAFDEELGTWAEVDDQLTGRDGVTLHGRTPHAKFVQHLRTTATVALDAWVPNPERLLAATTRTVEYLHAGLPVITMAAASWAPALLRTGAGWTIRDAWDLPALLESLTPAAIARASAAATELARTEHTIEAAGTALTEWLESPSHANRGPTLPARLLAVEREHLDEELASRDRSHLAIVEGLKDAQAAELDALKAKAAADIDALSAAHRETVEGISEGHRQETAKILADRQREIREMIEHWQGELDGLRLRLEGELKAQAERHADELRAVQAERAEERSRQQEEIQALAEAHRVETRAAAEDARKERDADRDRHEAEVERLIQTQREEMETARGAREAEVQQIVGQWQAELAQADAQRTGEMETADERHRAEIEAAVADWQGKLDDARERLRAAKARHAEEIARLKVELGAAESRAATLQEEAPPGRSRIRVPNLPGRSGQALRLARLWVEHALDRDN